MIRKRDISADQALQRLIDGNERFLAGAARAASPSVETMTRLTRGQHPFATILGCSDSRVPPEWIFDAGLGELFVVRVAGNVLSPEVAGSLQYAGAHLHTSLFVVLGHEGCGAVQAALKRSFKVFVSARGSSCWWTPSCRRCRKWIPTCPRENGWRRP